MIGQCQDSFDNGIKHTQAAKRKFRLDESGVVFMLPVRRQLHLYLQGSEIRHNICVQPKRYIYCKICEWGVCGVVISSHTVIRAAGVKLTSLAE